MSLPKLDIPSYELVIPSSNKKVKFRPFLVKEHKSLLMVTKDSNEEISRVAKEIVDICTFNKLNINDLPNFDIDYMFVKIRSKSIGEKVNLVLTCTKCENKIPFKLNLDDLKIKRDERHSKKIMITSSVGVEMRYPSNTLNLYELIEGGLEEYFKEIQNYIQAIYTTDGKYLEIDIADKDELSDFVSTMTSEQFARIEDFFLTIPKLSHDIEIACDKCQTINTATVEGLSNFFV